MSALSRSNALIRARNGSQLLHPSLQSQHATTTVSYRAISSIQKSPRRISSSTRQDPIQPLLRSQFLPTTFHTSTTSQRLLHTSPTLLAKVGKPRGGSAASEAPPPPKQDPIRPAPEEPAQPARPATEEAAQGQTQEGSQQDGAKQQQQSEGEDSSEGKKEQEGEGEGEKKKQEQKAPPPPHGDKSPWQVFTDTLKTEFKASKEWNDSTKQLAGSVQEFQESEAVRRARIASEAVSSTTGKVLKGTGKAIGQSAAWTWDTLPVKGVRASVNATGRGLEKVTRPVRQTEAFKSVAEVIDDGSSSRYGGWIDKEQRKKLREAREAKEIAEGRRAPLREKMEEDEEYARPLPYSPCNILHTY